MLLPISNKTSWCRGPYSASLRFVWDYFFLITVANLEGESQSVACMLSVTLSCQILYLMLSSIAAAHTPAEAASTIARGCWYISMVISMILSAMKYKRVVDCLKWSCPAGAIWKNLQRMAVLTLSLSLSSAFAFACLTFSKHALPLQLLWDPPQLHTNALELRIHSWNCWLWRRVRFTDSNFLKIVTRNADPVHQSTKVNCTLRLSSKAWLASGISAFAGHRYLLMSEMQWTATRLFPAALVFPCWIWSSVQRSWAKLCGLCPSCREKLKLDVRSAHIITYLFHTDICDCVCVYFQVCDVYVLLIDIDWHWYWIASDRVHSTHVAAAFSNSFHLSAWIK